MDGNTAPHFSVGDHVRRKHGLPDVGIIEQIIIARDRVSIRFPNGRRTLPLDQIETIPLSAETAGDLLRSGSLSPPRALRHHLAHIRLSGRLSDMLYSLEATDTDFYAHQFKPVLKLLDSPTGHLLIADEVGLGKTIEAGLIWTELAARFRHKRLVVVCPKVLCEKWQMELMSKFDIDAQIMTPGELRTALTSHTLQRRGFAAICAMQAVRPRRAEDRTGRPADLLANELEALDAFDDRIDLLVVDEAHHMRNPGTQTSAVGRMMGRIANHVVMLSATPINLRNRDLHSLLRLLDEDTFRDERSLEDIIEANAPVIAARDAVVAGRSRDEIIKLLDAAAQHELLARTEGLRAMRTALSDQPDPTLADRAQLAARLDTLNLLANVITRTRRRDVQEHRVQREVEGLQMTMTPLERGVYELVTDTVRRFAADRGGPAGFLTVMPQRMLASCMPAAVAHWQNQGWDAVPGIEDVDDSDVEENERGALSRELGLASRGLPASAELAAEDTKFACFLDLIRRHRASDAARKIVVFSTFRPTLAYLEKRLKDEGIGAIRMDGTVPDRASVIETFQEDSNIPVLLSSEIGSEGIDLQFANAMVNYDLPWNPMRVEQRIGRIDRLGQAAPKVFVHSLTHEQTIEAVIWERLYQRLGLCERALGGFEAILADKLERELRGTALDRTLTDAQRSERVAQTAQAFENNRRDEDELEQRAASLIAHGDYVAAEIKRKRDDGHWITQDDLALYVAAGLDELHPGSKTVHDKNRAHLQIRLNPETREAYRSWCERSGQDGGELLYRQEAVTFRLGSETGRRRFTRLSSSHPLVRFVADGIDHAGGLTAAAVAFRCEGKACDLTPGIYIGAVQEWRFGSEEAEQQLAWALSPLAGEPLLPREAEAALRRAVASGSPWTGASEELDLAKAAERLDDLVETQLEDTFDMIAERRLVEARDRLAIQHASLERSAERDRARLLAVIQKGGAKMEAANRGRLLRLDERVASRRIQLERRVDEARESAEVAVLLLRVDSSE